MAKWKKDCNPEELINEIEGSRKVSEDGTSEFQVFAFKNNVTILYSMVDFSKEIPEIDGRQITTRAVLEVGKKEKITQKNLITEITNQERDYFALPLKRFSLVSSISLSNTGNLNRIYLDERNQIIFEPRLSERFIREERKIKKRANYLIFGEPPNDYLAVRTHITARSTFHASEIALEDLDFIRGIWNFFENRRHLIRLSSGRPTPVNKIVLGPYHFLHFPNGKLASEEVFWYEKTYLGAIRLHTFNNIGEVEEFTKKIRSYIKKSKYKKELKIAVVRYSRALDERIWDNAFLKLWSVLELLTNTATLSYIKTIERTAFIYENNSFVYQILNQLREYRNSFVHADEENSEIETYLYQLKNIVEDLIYFHIFNSFGFNSLEEVGRFLSLPHDKNALKLRSDMANYALEYFYGR